MSIPAQPQIDQSLMFLRSAVEKCNHHLDLYGSFCPLERTFTVEQVALTGTLIDISDFFSHADFRSWTALVNEDGAGHEEAQSRALDVMFGDDLQRLDALGIGA
ncbi:MULTISPECIES: hypothetical protein [unclassified Herbaspirillum]|uniref:hypothetical protein n=1 Tax=unclassified Herbaspirillum TaxID=2624150 RepID=UPI000C0AB806|nr:MULTISPECIES: hypothetical protein [unclassified Herbaspirillum]MAF04930.1 hypothetical protein [Herbaspirillum sp.]MBO18478.1 hypothetical protein [Herbaspirillum sp.]|tara:strand:+ start:1486 stop:1797 length:312 start_codon:yes stop_codon:yes gene_type:complete